MIRTALGAPFLSKFDFGSDFFWFQTANQNRTTTWQA
jgi:hypothetical protein